MTFEGFIEKNTRESKSTKEHRLKSGSISKPIENID
jgi:hypothetical protein